jgi:hypothetical protein
MKNILISILVLGIVAYEFANYHEHRKLAINNLKLTKEVEFIHKHNDSLVKYNETWANFLIWYSSRDSKVIMHYYIFSDSCYAGE